MSCFDDELILTEVEANDLGYTDVFGVGKTLNMVPFDPTAFTKLDTPSFATEGGFDSSLVQLVFTFDLLKHMEEAEPLFFKDCYSLDDRVAKATTRLSYLKLAVTSSDYDRVVLLNTNTMKDYGSKTGITLTENFVGFIQPNGYLNVVMLSKLPATGGKASLSGDIKLSIKFKSNVNEDGIMRTFRFDGVKQPSWVRVQEVVYPMTAPVSNENFSLNGGKHLYDRGQSYGKRYITLKLAVVAKTPDLLREKFFDLADWFDTGYTAPLKFSDAPDITWFVKMDGETDVTEALNVGKFNITFLCMEKDGIGNEVVDDFEVDYEDRLINVVNEGTAETFPKVKLTIEEDTSFLDIVGSGVSENISLGQHEATGITEGEFDPTPLIATYNMVDNEGWKRMSESQFPKTAESWDYYRTDGVMIFNKGYAMMNGWHYGVPPQGNKDGWRCDGNYQTLNKSLTDFRIEISPEIAGVNPPDPANFADIILYDQNGKPFARIQFGRRSDYKLFDVYLEPIGADGTEIKNSRIWLWNSEKWDNWFDFTGKIIVERRQNKWRLTVGNSIRKFYFPGKAEDSTFDFGEAMLKNVISSPWQDLPRETWNAKLTQVGFILKNYQDRYRVPFFTVRKIKIWEYLTPPQEDTRKVLSFKAGDEVVVDFNKAQVWLNGKLEPSLVHPSTDWFSLKKGNNVLGFNNVKAKVKVVRNERFK